MKKLLLLLALAVGVSLAQTTPPHPRMGLNSALMGQFQALRNNNDPVWTDFSDWMIRKKAGSAAYTYVGQDEDGFLLGYAITKDKAMFDLAWASLSKSVYTPTGSLRMFFSTDCNAGALYCDSHKSAYQGGGLVTLVAKLYDYGYDQLTTQQRTDLVTWLNNAADAMLANVNASTYFRNDGAITVKGLNAVYLATLGENPRSAEISTAWHAAWAEQVKALNIMSIGGGMGEGNGYGALTMSTIVDIANSTFYGTGEDLFASSTAFKSRLGYDAFSTYPKPFYGPGDPYYPTQKPMPENASIAGDSIRWFGWATMALQPMGRMLSRHYAGTEEAGLWNWVFRQPDTDHTDDPWVALYTYSPRPALVKPTKLSWYSQGNGMVYVRQNWDSQDSTWVASWAGPHFDLHQHLDQGAFDLVKRRNLLPSTGDYDSSTMGTVHWLNYYSRTVATNNILVGDPNEYFWGLWAWTGCAPLNTQWANNHTLFPLADGTGKVCPANDGGQRTMLPYSMSLFSLSDYTDHRNVYDVAKVVSFQDSPDVVQWVQDTTNAYTSPAMASVVAGDGTTFVNPSKPKVTEVKRRYVYSRLADVLVVADTVEATDATFEKSDVFHSLAKLEVLDGVKADMSPVGESLYVGGTTTKITLDDTHPNSKGQTTADYRLGYAAAFVQTVFPAKAQLRVIGGREPADVEHSYQGQTDPTVKQQWHFHTHVKDFWVKDYSEGTQADHKSANWAPTYPANRSDITASMVGGFGVSRVHVQPTVAQKRDYFLNVIQPSLDPAATPLVTTRLETDTTFGVSFTSANKVYSVVFPKTGDGAAVVTVDGAPPVPTVTQTAPATTNTTGTTTATTTSVPTTVPTVTSTGPSKAQLALIATVLSEIAKQLVYITTLLTK